MKVKLWSSPPPFAGSPRRAEHPPQSVARSLLIRPVVAALVLTACVAYASRDVQATVTASPEAIFEERCGATPGPLSDQTFFVKALGSRCIDVGQRGAWAVGAPVFINDCDQSVGQQIRVRELDAASHDVELRVASFCIGVRGQSVKLGSALELQTCGGGADKNSAPAQRFALDGDAILVGIQASGRVTRDYVIEPDKDHTAAYTPLVVGTRELSDAEYFRFWGVRDPSTAPTSGFIRAADEVALDQALRFGWGTVIEVGSLEIKDTESKRFCAGVTLRGYRKHTDQGPEIIGKTLEPAFVIEEKDVRITGLRLRGLADVSSGGPEVSAVQVAAGADSRVILDRIDIGYWTGSAIDVRGGDYSQSQTCPGLKEFPRQPFARAVGNFIHHNDVYGVVSGTGAFSVAQANVMYKNRHDVAADPLGNTGYSAYDNLIQSPTNDEHRFDAHGSLHPGHWYGGIAGDYFDLGWNTFLTTDEADMNLRGTPCRFMAFHDNSTQQSQGDAVVSLSTDPVKTVFWGNSFKAANPMFDLAVGDFDGDGIDDVFVGTGTGWYFSSGGQAEWRFLNRMPEHANSLRFGDFDGDGRTDVLALHGNNLEVSWAGISPWETVNTTTAKLEDIAVGDFDTATGADIFVADGTDWFLASSGSGPWTYFAHSGFRTPDLRFGDFNGDGKTDVFSVGAHWQYVPGGGLGATWIPLVAAYTNNADGLVVADFDGDGVADVARMTSKWLIFFTWEYSRSGIEKFVALRSFTLAPGMSPDPIAPVGRFDGDTAADVILWTHGHFSIAPGGRDPVAIWSRQWMR